ncbi:MAG: hypothetical protein M0R03_03530 [Novosphingobium sp.]|nr:hypothetical protein [Novosphingobium sp.]
MDFRGEITCNHLVGNPAVSFTLQNCPRCLGKGVYGGISTDGTGDISFVEKADYLEQNIKKILISKRNNRGYGFNYELLKSVIDPTTTTVIKREVIRCLTFLQAQQQEDKKRGVRYLPSEEIVSISDVQVGTDEDDPRIVLVSLSVYTLQGNQVKVTESLFR